MTAELADMALRSKLLTGKTGPQSVNLQITESKCGHDYGNCWSPRLPKFLDLLSEKRMNTQTTIDCIERIVCLEQSRPDSQTPSSERMRQGISTV